MMYGLRTLTANKCQAFGVSVATVISALPIEAQARKFLSLIVCGSITCCYIRKAAACYCV